MKKVPNCPFLYQRGQFYYFRKRLLGPQLDWFGRVELKASLRTGDRVIATKRCLQLSLKVIKFEEWISKLPNIQTATIDRISKAYFKGCLEQCKAVAPTVLDGDPLGLDFELECWENEHKALLRSKATGEKAPPPDFGILKNLQEAGEHIYNRESREIFLSADIEISRIMVAMYREDFKNAVPAESFAPGTVFSEKGSACTESSPSISEVTQKYISYKSKGDWCGKTLLDQKRVMGWLKDHVGYDQPLSGLKLETIRSFRDGLMAMPCNAAKYPELAGLKFSELGKIDDKKWPRVSIRTAKKYFEMGTGFLKWCVEEGYLETSPARKLRIKHSFNPQQARFPFSPDQLDIFFKSPLFTGCRSRRYRAKQGPEVFRDAWFWVPLVGLYSGMRLGEIIDLDLADIQEIEGVLTFSVGGTEGEKRLKTINAKRLIPVHTDLLRLGFEDYVEEAMARDRDGRVFAGLKISKTGYSSHNFSKWFSRYLKNVGIKTPKTTFHSLRHNFKDGLRQAGVPDGVQNKLMGHSDNGVAATYGSGWSLDVLETEINKVSFSRFLDHLAPEPDESKIKQQVEESSSGGKLMNNQKFLKDIFYGFEVSKTNRSGIANLIKDTLVK